MSRDMAWRGVVLCEVKWLSKKYRYKCKRG